MIAEAQRAEIISRRREGQTMLTIAAAMGISVSTVHHHCKEAALHGTMGTRPVLDGFQITKITSKDEDGNFVTQKPEPDEPEIPAGHIIERATIKRGDDWLKTKLVPSTLTRDDLLEIFAEYRGKSELIQPPELTFTSALLTVYPISDLHLGMQAWGRELGVPWDLKLACSTALSSMTELVQCTPPSNTAVLIDLGDYTHANNQQNITPASGHQLDVDGRFPKIGREALRLRVQFIELLLQKHHTVIVRGLPGNHDPEVAQMLQIALSLFFENNSRVSVDDDPSDFWFFQHGVVMLAANHGHKLKPDRLPGVMASYKPEMWGSTKVRQAWSGHIHHTRAGEENGARWETLRTAAPRDAYAHQHGYSAGRELTAWTYHNERGLRARQVVELL